MNIEIEKKYNLRPEEVDKVKSQIESIYPCEWGVFDTLDIRFGMVKNQFGSVDFHRLRFQKAFGRLKIYLANKYSDESGVRRDEEIEIDFDDVERHFVPGRTKVLRKVRSTTTLETKNAVIPELKIDIDELPHVNKAFMELEVMTDDMSNQEAIFAFFAVFLANCNLVIPETNEKMIDLSDDVEIVDLNEFLTNLGFTNYDRN